MDPQSTARLVKIAKKIKKVIDKDVVNLDKKDIQDNGAGLLMCAYTDHIVELSLAQNNLSAYSAVYFKGGRWKNLKNLVFTDNEISDIGCKFLGRAKMPSIQKIQLARNYISQVGVLHLSKVKWKKLNELALGKNRVNDRAVLYLIKADWKKLQMMWLNNSQISGKGLRQIMLAEWPKITEISGNNNCFEVYQTESLTNCFINRFKNVLVYLYTDSYAFGGPGIETISGTGPGPCQVS